MPPMPDMMPQGAPSAGGPSGMMPGPAPVGMAAPPNAPPGMGPASSPMVTPQAAIGEKTAAMSQVQIAITLLERALPALKVTSPEGDSVMTALKSLAKHFGAREGASRSLIPSEIMNLVASLPKQPPQGA
jgi:hypothetical protein